MSCTVKPLIFGNPNDVSDGWVQCFGCGNLIGGASFADRMRAWHEHVAENECSADVDLDPSLAQYLA
jgi:hypothetical protein